MSEKFDHTPIQQGIKHGPHRIDLPYQQDADADSPHINENVVAMHKANMDAAIKAVDEGGDINTENVAKVYEANKLAIGKEQNRAMRAHSQALAEAHDREDRRMTQY